MAQKSQIINITENRYKVVKNGLLGSTVEAIITDNFSNRPSLSSVHEKFRISDRHSKNEIFFILLSAGYDKGQEGVSIDYLLSCNNDTTRKQIEKYLDEIVNRCLFSYDKLTRRYKITNKGLYYVRSYAVTGMDIF